MHKRHVCMMSDDNTFFCIVKKVKVDIPGISFRIERDTYLAIAINQRSVVPRVVTKVFSDLLRTARVMYQTHPSYKVH